VLPGYLLHRLLAQRSESAGAAKLLAGVLIGLTGAVQVLLFADRVILGMYGFHINCFVIDLDSGDIDAQGGIPYRVASD